MRRLRNDDGAIAVIVAVFMVAALGLAALVIDAGGLLEERRELQNAADAGSLAIAQECGFGPCTGGSAQAAATSLADQNTLDGTATVSEICSNEPRLLGTGEVTACDPPAEMPSGARFVTVDTQTRTVGTGPVDEVPAIFSGNDTRTGSTVNAQSTTVWGGPATVEGAFPLTISYCEWAVLTNGGQDLLDWPATTADLHANGNLEQKIVLFGGPNTRTTDAPDSEVHNCAEAAANTDLPEQPAADGPGGFGWAEGTRDDCASATIEEDGTYDSDSGVGAVQGCKQELADLYAQTWSGTPQLIFLPSYETYNNGTYTLQSQLGFVITGYYFSTGCGGTCKRASQIASATHPANEFCNVRNWDDDPHPVNPPNPALAPPPNQNCITGFFVRAEPPENSGPVSGPSLGVTVVNLFE